MPVEIERKFLVPSAPWNDDTPYSTVLQGYCARDEQADVRIRVVGEQALLTIKSSDPGIMRQEFEYGIPVDEAKEMLELFCAGRTLTKRRYHLDHAGRRWIVDEFMGALQGLLLAEIELATQDERVEMPDWIGEEVTGRAEYLNASLAAAAARDTGRSSS